MDDMNTVIVQNEQANSGRDIHIFFNSPIGYYTAYGLSAFLADHIIEGLKSYSEAYEMPVIIVSPGEVLSLRGATNKVAHEPRKYYHFTLKYPIGKEGYVKWTNSLKRKV